MKSACCASVLMLMFVSSPAAAAPPPPGHSHHGEVFDEGPRQRAYLMPGMPKIDFPVTTKSAQAQAFFNQGVGQLHGFWYFEAEALVSPGRGDRSRLCNGLLGSGDGQHQQRQARKGFIAKAVARKAAATPRERAWIESLAGYYASPDNAARRRQYVRALEGLVQDNPRDVEAKAFLALQIWINGEWMTDSSKRIPISSYQAVDALIDQVLAVNPMHPVHHYRIHLWDGEKPIRALQSCALCGQSAPGIAHMWHMPGHIYSDLHRYADAAWQQEASTRTDHAYMMRDGVLPDQIFNYAHNNEWLIRDLNLIGRAHDAIALSKNMIDLPRHPHYNMPGNGRGSSHFGRARLLGTLTQYERWADLVDLFATSYLPPLDTPDDAIERARLLGRASRTGTCRSRPRQLAKLTALLADERAAALQIGRRGRGPSPSRASQRRGDSPPHGRCAAAHAGRIRALEHAVAEVKGRLALAAGDRAAAKAEFDKIKDSNELRRDQLAEIYLRLGAKTEAEDFARAAANGAPGEVYPLATEAAVLFAIGKKPEAEAQFAKLRTLAGHADLDQPVFERLKPLVAALHLPADWRTPRTPTDVGQRPDLATLGPLCWRPGPAPNWSLPEPDGHPLSLAHYRGKPVLILFYLGSGCLHCVEQLKKFSPMAGRFSAAGISIVAISSEPLDSLKQSLTTLKKNERIDFPLVSDADRSVFRAYRAYDDFENMPLHGVFLIDGAGRIRWQDIGYEPFMDPTFVLDEARRLLHR